MYVGVDTETHLFRSGYKTPRLVCMTLATFCGDNAPQLDDLITGATGRKGVVTRLYKVHGVSVTSWLLDREAARLVWPALLAAGHDIVFHNAEYDSRVLMGHVPDQHDALFDAYEQGRVWDTQIREKLIANAHGDLGFRLSAFTQKLGIARFNLAELVMRYFGEDITHEKTDPDAWRERYAELDGVPVDQWPERAVEYAVMDAVWALLVVQAQASTYLPQLEDWDTRDPDHPLRFAGELHETRSALPLGLGAGWGMRTEEQQVRRTIGDWEARAAQGVAVGKAAGFIRDGGKRDGSTNTKALRELIATAYEQLGAEPPRTEKGQIRYATDVLRDSGDAALMEYAECKSAVTWLSKYAHTLELGLSHPITYRVDSMKATGRLSVSKPPLHQPPRKGGFRECFVPRPGHVFLSADYDQIEIRALAQICHWWGLGDDAIEIFRRGSDPHSILGADILAAEGVVDLGVPAPGGRWDEATLTRCRRGAEGAELRTLAEDARQLAKAGNFGLMGGLGVDSFIAYTWQAYEKRITRERAETLFRLWRERFPAFVAYLQEIGRRAQHGSFTVAHPVTGMLRGDCSYTSGANTHFQGLCAAGFKHTAWLLMRQMYVSGGPLSGCRMVLPLHDEFILEVPEDRTDEAAAALTETMEAGMGAFLPDVPVTVEAAAMRRWYKGAKPVRVDGQLVPWKPT